MANTTYHPTSTYPSTVDLNLIRSQSSVWAIPVARVLFSLLFVFSGLGHFADQTIAYGASKGVPMAEILVPFSGLMIIVGGLSVMLGYHARIGALLIMLFLATVTGIMHNFWAIPDPAQAQVQMINFFKNLSLFGGALLICFYGAGPISIDARTESKNREATKY